jgi:hypothetical protein
MVYFARTEPGHPDPIPPKRDNPESWRIYEICDENSKFGSLLRRDIRAATSVKDKQGYRTSLIHFVAKAQIGMPLKEMYDEKQLHEAFSYKRKDGKESTVWRLRGTGDTRLYFVYAPKKRIVILNINVKRSDKLTSGEKEELKGLSEMVIETLETYEFELRIIS